MTHTAPDVVLRTEGLVKDYRAHRRRAGRNGRRGNGAVDSAAGPRPEASVRALDGLDLEVRRGEVFGFLGPNGAGKSTTIRILLDQLRPTAGRAEVLGVTPQQGGPALRARIGYLPGELAMSGRATAGELLGHLARLRGGAGASRIGPLAERFALDLDKPIRSLSKGNKQKVGVIQAFMHAPEVLVLDEPTSGLDPLLQQEFLALVREAQAGGATVFMSSHVLSEVEVAAERVAIVRAGRIVDVDDVRALRLRAGQRVELVFGEPVRPEEFDGVPGVTDAVVGDSSLRCLLHGEPDALLKAASRHRVVRWSAANRELEDLFLDFYREPAAAGTRADEEVARRGR